MLEDGLAPLHLELEGVDVPEDETPAREMLFERWKSWEVRGFTRSEVAAPGVTEGEDTSVEREEDTSGARGRNASRAARRRRLVVPVDFESPERAEHTTATRLPSMYDLHRHWKDIKDGPASIVGQ